MKTKSYVFNWQAPPLIVIALFGAVLLSLDITPLFAEIGTLKKAQTERRKKDYIIEQQRAAAEQKFENPLFEVGELPPPPPPMPETPIVVSPAPSTRKIPVTTKQVPAPDELAKIKRDIIEFYKTTNEDLGLTIRTFFNKSVAKIKANTPIINCLTLYINVLKSVIKKRFFYFYAKTLRSDDESAFITKIAEDVHAPAPSFIAEADARDISQLINAVPDQKALDALKDIITVKDISLSEATIEEKIADLEKEPTPKSDELDAIQQKIIDLYKGKDASLALTIRDFFNKNADKIVKNAAITQQLTLYINVLKSVIKKRFFYFYDEMLRNNVEQSIITSKKIPTPQLKSSSKEKLPLEPSFIKKTTALNLSRLINCIPNKDVLNALKDTKVPLKEISRSDDEITKKIAALQKELAAPKPVITRAPSPRRAPTPMTQVPPAPSPRPSSPRAQQGERQIPLLQELAQKNRIDELSIREKNDTISPEEQAELKQLKQLYPGYKGLSHSPGPVKPLPTPPKQREKMLEEIRTKGQGGLRHGTKTEKADELITKIKDEIKMLEEMINPTDIQTKHLRAQQKLLKELEAEEARRKGLLRESELLKNLREQVEPEEETPEEEDPDWEK
ncbi:MAG: hypothetical protein WCW33_02140 [Candidatus Babeliales bacterium]